MQKKIVIGIILIVIVIFVGMLLSKSRQVNVNKNLIYTPSANDSEAKTNRNTGKTVTDYMASQINLSDRTRYIDIAKQTILTKPKLHWYSETGNGDKIIEWGDVNQIGAALDEKFIVSLEPTIGYNKPNFYPAPDDYMNDKYSLRWFFVPGCKENVNSNEENNWYDNSGKQCFGGYLLEVLINKDNQVERVSLAK